MPNFSLAPALDVLCTGSYPRLPSCIRDNIVPPSPLTGPEADAALSLLTVAIRRRLLCEQIPPQMTVRSLGEFAHYIHMYSYTEGEEHRGFHQSIVEESQGRSLFFLRKCFSRSW